VPSPRGAAQETELVDYEDGDLDKALQAALGADL
jgi:hypothetical protein